MGFKKTFNGLFELFQSRQFIILTIGGNSFILVLSMFFYLLESHVNPMIHSYLDAVWWTFSTITSVGYGDIVPITNSGKILGIIIMLIGTGLFATYTALFANALLGREFLKINRKMRVIYNDVEGIREEAIVEEIELAQLIDNLKDQIEHLEKRLSRE